jgi:hypothetical protein
MKKSFLFLSIALTTSLSLAQKKPDTKPQTTKPAAQTTPIPVPAPVVQGIPVVITGQIFKAPADKLNLSTFMGNGQYVDYATFDLAPNGDGKFSISAVLPVGDFYVLRAGSNHVNLIITKSDTIKVFGDGRDMLRNINIVGRQ